MVHFESFVNLQLQRLSMSIHHYMYVSCIFINDIILLYVFPITFTVRSEQNAAQLGGAMGPPSDAPADPGGLPATHRHSGCFGV